MKRPLVLLVLFSFAWVIAQAESSEAHESAYRISPPPGRYRENQLVAIEPIAEDTQAYYEFVDDIDSADSPLIPIRDSLSLSALPGEERTYRLRLQERPRSAADTIVSTTVSTIVYTVDRRPPLPPATSLDSGEYWGPVALSFASRSGEKVFYAVDGSILAEPRQWDGAPIRLEGVDDQRVRHSVQAYSRDEAGNRSTVEEYTFWINRKKPIVHVFSPVSGVFANYQMLFIDSRHVEWVKYTLDGSDPLVQGTAYTGPKMLPLAGTTRLRIVAKPRLPSEALVHSDVTYTVRPESEWSIISDAKSGVFSAGVKVKLLSVQGTRVFYTLNERMPTENDLRYSSILSFDSVPNARRMVTLRARAVAAEGVWSGEYRFLFAIDRRIPAVPEILLGTALSNKPVEVLIRSSDESSVYFTLDGSIPDRQSPPYTEPVVVEPDFAGPDGLVTVKARGFSEADKSSDLAFSMLHFDLEQPEPPRVEMSSKGRQISTSADYLRTAGAVVVTVNSPADSRIVFEVFDPAQMRLPDALSPQSPEQILVDVPYGIERQFDLRFASVDGAGNVTQQKALNLFAIDRKPPNHPLLSHSPDAGPFDRDIALSMNGDGKIYYSITSDGSTPTDPSTGSSAYSVPIALAGSEGDAVSYQIKLLCVDDLGNSGGVIGPYSYTIDRRKPVLPELHGIRDGEFYNTQPIGLRTGNREFPIRYSVSRDGTEPADPTAESELLPDFLSFPGELGKEITYRLKLLPVSSGGNEGGDIRHVRFTVDLRPPVVPTLTGFHDGQRYRRPIAVSIERPQPDERYFLSVSVSENDPPDPIQYGEEVLGSVTFDVPEGEERTIRLRVAAMDSAGNRSPHDGRSMFALDRKPPPQPLLVGLPENGIINEPVAISFPPQEGRIVYEMSSDGSLPPLPGPSSPAYDSPIVLRGADGAEVTYRILARAVDDLENFGEVGRAWKVIVDREAPGQPPAPRVESSGGSGSQRTLVEWNVPSDHVLHYRSLVGAFPDDTEYVRYAGPFEAEGNENLECYFVDAAGNAGPLATYPVEVRRREPTPPAVLGVEEGGIYREAVELSFTAEEGSIRYELTVDGTEPREVIATSPSAEGAVRLDALYDETASFSVRARTFSEAERVSEETRVSFVIDRTPPSPPVVVGIEPDGHYNESRTVNLFSDEGEIYYSLSDESEAQRYQNPLSLVATEGEVIVYRISAYTVDRAGNRSTETPTWTATFDRDSVYVSSYGDDENPGTRGQPFRTLARAVDWLKQKGRTRVYVSLGRFSLDRPLSVDFDLKIVGGLDPFTWRPAGLERRSVIENGKYFRPDDVLATVSAGSVEISGVELADVAGKCSSLVQVTGGRLILRDCLVVLENRQVAAGVVVSAGSASIADSKFVGREVSRGSFVRVSSGSVSLVDTELIGPQRATEFSGMVLNGGSHTVTGSIVRPGAGAITRGILAVDSEVVLKGTTIGSGSGRDGSVCMELKRSTVEISGSTIETHADGQYPVGILSEDSSVSVHGSQLLVSGKFGATGIRAKRGSLEVIGTWIRGNQTQDFLYLIDPSGFASRQAFLNQMAATNHDLLIVDLFDVAGTQLTSTDVAGLKQKANDGTRLVLAYMNIGAVENWRYYWQTDWGLGNPSWIASTYEGWAGEYWVRYWDDAWQNIIFGSTGAYLDRIIAAGFDGVYLDNILAYEEFE